MSSTTASNGDEKIAEAISTAAKDTVPGKTDRFVHKYKWRGEEITILFVLYSIAIAFGAWAVVNDMSLGFFIAGGIALVLAGSVTRLGASRKHKSRLIGTYDHETSQLTVEGNGLDAAKNTAKLTDVKKVFTKKVSRDDDVWDPRDFLMLGRDKGIAVQIPMRLVSRPGMLELITELVGKVNIKEDPNVTGLLESAAEYR